MQPAYPMMPQMMGGPARWWTAASWYVPDDPHFGGAWWLPCSRISASCHGEVVQADVEDLNRPCGGRGGRGPGQQNIKFDQQRCLEFLKVLPPGQPAPPPPSSEGPYSSRPRVGFTEMQRHRKHLYPSAASPPRSGKDYRHASRRWTTPSFFIFWRATKLSTPEALQVLEASPTAAGVTVVARLGDGVVGGDRRETIFSLGLR